MSVPTIGFRHVFVMSVCARELVGCTTMPRARVSSRDHATPALLFHDSEMLSQCFQRFEAITYSREVRLNEKGIDLSGGQGRNRTADASLFRAALYRLSYLAIPVRK